MGFERLVREVRQVGLITFYFLVCFALLLLLKKLFLAQYAVEFYGVSAAVVGALVVGKVVVLLDHSGLGSRFDRERALWIGVAYRTLVYTVVTFVVVVVEKVIHEVRAGEELAAAVTHVWEHRDRNVMLATVLCIALAFAGYNVYAALDRRLGEGTLRRLLLHRPGPEA